MTFALLISFDISDDFLSIFLNVPPHWLIIDYEVASKTYGIRYRLL